MKKLVVILVILVVLVVFYIYAVVDTMGTKRFNLSDISFDWPDVEQFKFWDKDDSESEHVKGGDDSLIQAVIRSDGQEIERILSSSENGEFIRLFKSLKPEKIYSIRDVARLNCMPGPVCKNKDIPNAEYLTQCVDGSLYLMNDELKKFPSCKKYIDEFYTVHYLCQLYQKQTVCIEDDPMESTEDRTKRLTARGQNSADCLMRHLDDFNAKNKCVTNAPRYTFSQFEEQVKKYCQQAISCDASLKESDCINKYKALLKEDKKKGKDCTNSHLTAITQEIEMVNFLLEKQFGTNAYGESYTSCELVRDYEQMMHVEDIFAKVKTIQEYNTAVVSESQKAGKSRLTWQRLPIYLPPRNEQYNKMVSESVGSYTYYMACKMGHLSAK